MFHNQLKNAVDGIQHSFLVVGYLLFPTILMTEIGATMPQIVCYLSVTVLFLGIFSYLQITWMGVGHMGVLAPNPYYLILLITAGKLGGVSMVFGITAISGIIKVFFSFFLSKGKNLLPPQVSGIVIFLSGLGFAQMSMTRIAGYGGELNLTNFGIALAVFVTFATVSIQSRFMELRKFGLIFALIVGYMICIPMGLIEVQNSQPYPLFAFPSFSLFNMSFSSSLIIPAFLVTMASIADIMGVEVIYQRAIQGDTFKETDMTALARGLRLTGLATIAGGVFGGMPFTMATANASYCLASKRVSNSPAPYLCAFFVLLALTPKLTFVISSMPHAITGAVLLYMASYMICTGISMIADYLLDTQQILIIGVSILCAIGIPGLPMVKGNSNIFVQAVMSSSIAIGSSFTILLTFIFFVFTAKNKKLSLIIGEQTDVLKQSHIFFYSVCHSWHLQKNIYFRFQQVMGELAELITRQLPHGTTCSWTMEKKEGILTLKFSCLGAELDLPDGFQTENVKDVLHSDRVLDSLSVHIIKSNCDSFKKIEGKQGKYLAFTWI